MLPTSITILASAWRTHMDCAMRTGFVFDAIVAITLETDWAGASGG
jgi:hypothetical protein